MKTLRHLSLILMSSLLFMSCWAQQPGEEDDNPDPDIVESKLVIPLEEAEELFTNYGKNRVPIIEKFQNVDDQGNPISPDDERYIQATRSLSIDYHQLRTYMGFIEKEAKRANTDITGLRIYLGLYGDKNKNANTETTFLNPLMEFGERGNIKDDVSFAIKNVGGKATAVAVGDILKNDNQPRSKKGGTNLELNVQESIQSLAGNKFPRRPPPPPPNDPDY